jgi:histidinol-phosphate aminotransferase
MPTNFNLQVLLRENIRGLKPYKSARDEYQGKEGIFLDANENAFGSATKETFNRYPDPLQWEVKKALAPIKKVSENQIFIGNGSDEAIDLLFRCFCKPGIDNVIITPPTYGMYEVSANINDVKLIKVGLTEDFELEPLQILSQIDANTKLIILCSPNNPTGNCLSEAFILQIIQNFNGIVALDEAYIDFAAEKSLLHKLTQFPNLIIMQTFSKAWGLANLRLGLAFASEEIIQILNNVKPPYNISGLSQEKALEAIKNIRRKEENVQYILSERSWLLENLQKLSFVIKIYPSDANFLLVKTTDGKKIYDYLIEHQVIVRDRSNVTFCEGCLRITVGTVPENFVLIETLQNYEKEN